jgi:hypothetical protein
MPSFWKHIGLAVVLSAQISLPLCSFAQQPYSSRPGCATMQPFAPSIGGAYPGSSSITPRPESPPWLEPDPMSPDATTPPAPMTPDAMTTPDTALSFSTPETGIGSPDVAFASPGGYIDNPIPRTRFTLRFDAAYDNPTPDRAEFFYAKCGCFRGIDPNAPGPQPDNPIGDRVVESGVDYQEIWFNMEYAFMDRASVFAELPIRFINPEVNDNEAGLGDINFGLKYALIADANQFLTMQVRVYTPTGDAGDGLGTDHFSIEPALLYLRRLNQGWSIFGELRDWIPVDGSDGPVFPGGRGDDYASNVLRYGVGVAYNLIDNPYQGYQVSPVVELVGWHVFDGFASSSPDGRAENIVIENGKASIVNAKLGVRFTLTDASSSNFAGYGGSQSLYVGWGHALTNEEDVWYKNMLRVEYRVNF